MFIKKDAAKQRLEDPNNLLRKPRPNSTRLDKDGKTEEERRSEEIAERANRSARAKKDSEVPDPEGADGEEETDFSEDENIIQLLDPLINPNAYREKNPYKMNRPAQLAIAETGLMLGEKTAGRLFGLGDQQVARYEEGRMGNGVQKGKYIPELVVALKKSKEQIAQKAASRIETTLDILTEDRIKRVKKAVDVAKIGKDMAVILDKVSPKEQTGEGGVHFHVFVPEIRQENTYQIVNLGGSATTGDKQTDI